jgi:putative ABC transport system permease protein
VRTPSLGELLRRLRFLLFRERYTAELEEEIRFHIDRRAHRLHERGMPIAVARYAARRQFGNATTIQERSRDMWGFSWVEQFGEDVRFAARRLRNRPGFALATIVVAALGIGATTAVFSAIDAALLRPLPFVHPEQLVTLTSVNVPFDPGFERPRGRHMLDIVDVAAMPEVFSRVGAFAAGGLNLTDANNPRRVNAGVVTTGFFATLGARAQAGRTFDDAEGKPNGAHVTVISDALWQARFGGADMIGKSIELNGTRYTVVGVMPPGFSFPNESDLWIPMTIPTTFETFAPFRGFLPSQIVARLAPGVTPQAAAPRVYDAWKRLAGPPTDGKASNLDDIIEEVRKRGTVIPLQQQLVGASQKALVILMGATGLLLLIACANVANLLLSDAASRRREVALREVLGATRGRITRQLLAESLLLAVAGTLIGIALAPAVLGVLRAMMPADLAGLAPAELNLRVLAFATVLALVTGLVFGLWPALGTARADAAETIKSGGGLGATAGNLGVARRVLITAELALTVMLLIGSGLMLRSMQRVLSQDMGLNPERVATLELSFAESRSRYANLPKLKAILARLQGVPGIEAAAVVNDLPLRGNGGISISFQVDGAPPAKSMDDMTFARYLMASPDYFKALGIPLLRGRTFSAVADSLSPPEAVINSTMAKKWWPNTDALGKTFRFAGDTIPLTIVGIVADVRESGLERQVTPQVYFSIERGSPRNAAVIARGTLPPSAMMARLNEAVRAVDPAQAVYNVRTMDEVISKSVAPRRTNTTLIALFGGLALMLSAFGVYAVVSYSVTRRAREFGIRAALGATGRNIAALVGREMVGVVALGLALGIGGAWMLSRVMQALLYGVDAHDMTTFLAAPVLLVIPAIVATVVPARRAMRVSPTEVMRAE